MRSIELKVLQLGKFYYPDKGGIETVTQSMVDGFNGRVKTDVLCFNRSFKTVKYHDQSSLILKCGSLAMLSSTPISFSFFYHFFRIRNRYDVVHIHVPNPFAVFALLLFGTRAKVVIHWHSDILKQKYFYKVFQFFERKILKRADLILVATPPYLAYSKPLSNFKAKAAVLPYGIKPSTLPYTSARVNEIRTLYGGRNIIFSLGRFVYYKGFQYLIEAASLLDDNVVVLIGGKGDLLQNYQALINTYHLQSKVYLIEAISQQDVGNYYMACDVFCLPSCEKTEAFGVVMLEAMNFEKPVVAANIIGSGVNWVNQDGITGYNVAPKDPKAIADAIKRLLGRPKDNFFENNARNRFDQVFSQEVMINKLLEHYSILLKKE